MPPRKLSPITSSGARHISGKPLTDVPEPPSWMRPVAARKFVETASYLVDIGAITAGEIPLVEAYSAAYGRWAEAEAHMAGAPLTYRAVLNRQGEEASAVALPAQAQASKALDQMRKFSAALGLSPVERARLPAGPTPEGDDPVEQLFRDAGHG